MSKAKVKKNNDFWERNRKSNGYLLKRTLLNGGISLCRFILLFGMCFMILQPILSKISASFMTEADLYSPVVVNIPQNFTTDNYRTAAAVMRYGEALKNSLIISLTIAILQISMCTLVGYGFARFKFPLRNLWFGCVILVILVPPQTISTSLYLNFGYFDVFGIIRMLTGSTINMRSSLLPYYMLSATCMGLKNGLYIYMIRQFFRNIPKELEEAAYVDGCGTLKTFLRIMLPDAKPILTSCFLFAFVWQWTDGFYSEMFMGTKQLVSTSLTKVVDDLSVYVSKALGDTITVSQAYANCVLGTGTLMLILPLIILYLFAQKGFVESLSSSGIKM